MLHAAGHLARRALNAHNDPQIEFRVGTPTDPNDSSYHLPYWGVAIMFSTALVFALKLVMIKYAYGHVVPTLAMVESSTAAVYSPVESDDNNNDPYGSLDEKTSLKEPEVVLVKQKPITSGLRSTARHLRAQSGKGARLRGFALFFITHSVQSQVRELLGLTGVVPAAVAHVLAAVAVAHLSLTWTHQVMTKPSEQMWWQRLPTWATWKKVAGPTVAASAAEAAAFAVPMHLAWSWGLMDASALDVKGSAADCAELKAVALKAVAVAALGLVLSVLVAFPARVVLTRVQASLLSEQETEPIVPFDRTFGGKVVATADGGSGVLAMRDAWATFDWNSRINLAKIYVKVALKQTAVFVVGALLVVGEAKLIMGEHFDEFVGNLKF